MITLYKNQDNSVIVCFYNNIYRQLKPYIYTDENWSITDTLELINNFGIEVINLNHEINLIDLVYKALYAHSVNSINDLTIVTIKEN